MGLDSWTHSIMKNGKKQQQQEENEKKYIMVGKCVVCFSTQKIV